MTIMPHNQTPQETLLLQTGDDQKIELYVRILDDTHWINQRHIAALFGIEVASITYWLKDIFNSSEIDEAAGLWRWPPT